MQETNFTEFMKRIGEMAISQAPRLVDVVVEIRKNKTGKVHRITTKYAKPKACTEIFPSHESFSEGRLRCDCERKAIFLKDTLEKEQAEYMYSGKEPKARNFNHGTDAYSVNLYLVDNLPGQDPIERCFYREFGDPPAGSDKLQ